MTVTLTHFPPLFHHAPHQEPATLRNDGSFLHTLPYFSASTPIHLQHCCQINSPLNHHICFLIGPSLVPLTVKNLPAMQETWIRSLGQEDPLEKGMATRSSTLAWRIPWTAEPGRLQSMGLQRVGHDCVTNFHFHFLGNSWIVLFCTRKCTGVEF